MQKVLLLGFHISQKKRAELDKLDQYPSRQTFNYHSKIVECFQKIMCVELLSAYPVSDYPLCKKKYFKADSEIVSASGYENNAYDIKYMPFINTPLLKVISRFLSSFFYLYKSLKNKKPDYIVVYSVHLPFMLSSFLLGKLFRIKRVSIWTDPPALHNKTDSVLKSALRICEGKISRYLMSTFDKSIVISEWLAKDYNSCKPYLVVESICNGDELTSYNPQRSDCKIFTYTGTISRDYGLDLMLDTFSDFNEKIQLHLYGTGPDVKYLLDKIYKSSNIFYFGNVGLDIVKNIQSESSFLLNIRRHDDAFTRYSFPSKLTEYLQSSTPIISSRLDGIPLEYYDYLIPLNTYDVSELRRVVHKCILMEQQDVNSIGTAGKNFIVAKNIVYWAKLIQGFLND
ncbi:glycosyltransferase [Aeromonas veronii]|uniref:glycosyltransferase n=1 Tax=Aeromonas veronii TaxID=654 RepID=UPI003D2472FA